VFDIDGVRGLDVRDDFAAMGGVVDGNGFAGDAGGPLAVDVVGVGLHKVYGNREDTGKRVRLPMPPRSDMEVIIAGWISICWF